MKASPAGATAAACSAVSLALGEPLYATASHVRGYVLLEQPRPWGAKALLDSRLDPAVGRELEARAKELGLKALLVARPGGAGGGGRRAFLCASGQDACFLEELELDDPRELLSLDLGRLARGERLGAGRPVERPLYLVCTNGRRDACCARHGRAVVRALLPGLRGRIWECSHVGGHRFAANLLRLPEGLWLGRLDAAGAGAAVGALEQGRVPLERFRGRSCHSPAAQAAEWLVRERERLDAIGALAVEGERRLDGGGVEVRLAGKGARYAAVVRAEAAAPRPVSCGEDAPERPQVWSLVRLERDR